MSKILVTLKKDINRLDLVKLHDRFLSMCRAVAIEGNYIIKKYRMLSDDKDKNILYGEFRIIQVSYDNRPNYSIHKFKNETEFIELMKKKYMREEDYLIDKIELIEDKDEKNNPTDGIEK